MGPSWHIELEIKFAEGIMRYIIGLSCLTVFFFAISCAGQNRESKEKLANHLKVTETHGAEHQKLAPLRKESRDYVPGEILVKFKDGTDTQAIKAIQRELHLKTIKIVSRPNLYLMKILDGSSVERIVERLRNYEEVKYSEPNYIRTTN